MKPGTTKPTPAVKPAAADLPESGEAEIGDDAIADFLLDLKLDDEE